MGNTFYRLTTEEFLKVNGLLKDSELRVWLYLSTALPFEDSEAEIKTALIADKLLITQRTVQRAIKRLIQLELFDIEILTAKVKRHGRQFAPEGGVNCRVGDPPVASATIYANGGREMSPAMAESFAVQGFQNLPDLQTFQIIQTLSDSEKNNFSEEKKEEINSEAIKNGGSHKSTVIDQPSKDSAITVKSVSVDKYFGNSPNRELHEFLVYAGDDTPWLNPPRRRADINFKREFMEWQGQRWMQKFEKRDIHEAIADFRSSLLNNPDKIPGRWEEYENHILHHAGNIQIRLENGCQITEQEQEKMLTHLPVISASSTIPTINGSTENPTAYLPFKPQYSLKDLHRLYKSRWQDAAKHYGYSSDEINSFELNFSQNNEEEF